MRIKMALGLAITSFIFSCSGQENSHSNVQALIQQDSKEYYQKLVKELGNDSFRKREAAETLIRQILDQENDLLAQVIIDIKATDQDSEIQQRLDGIISDFLSKKFLRQEILSEDVRAHITRFLKENKRLKELVQLLEAINGKVLNKILESICAPQSAKSSFYQSIQKDLQEYGVTDFDIFRENSSRLDWMYLKLADMEFSLLVPRLTNNFDPTVPAECQLASPAYLVEYASIYIADFKKQTLVYNGELIKKDEKVAQIFALYRGIDVERKLKVTSMYFNLLGKEVTVNAMVDRDDSKITKYSEAFHLKFAEIY